jgi:hypothetical protein
MMGATVLLTRRKRLDRWRQPGWGFRTVSLNAVGAAAVLAPGAAAGAGLGLLTRTPPTGSPAGRLTRVLVLGIGGAVAGLILARIADEQRWRSMTTSLQLDEPDEALDLMQEIRAAGVEADMIRADADAHPDCGAYALRYRRRDEGRVRAVLAARRA